jgi:hypothetical protein
MVQCVVEVDLASHRPFPALALQMMLRLRRAASSHASSPCFAELSTSACLCDIDNQKFPPPNPIPRPFTYLTSLA